MMPGAGRETLRRAAPGIGNKALSEAGRWCGEHLGWFCLNCRIQLAIGVGRDTRKEHCFGVVLVGFSHAVVRNTLMSLLWYGYNSILCVRSKASLLSRKPPHWSSQPAKACRVVECHVQDPQEPGSTPLLARRHERGFPPPLLRYGSLRA